MSEEKILQKLKFNTEDTVSTPAVVDGVVYFASDDKHLYALDTKTGKEKWKFQTGDKVGTTPLIVDGMVYFGSDDNHLYAVNIKTGEEKWKLKIWDSIYSSLAVSDGIVYFELYDKHLYALDTKTDKEKWKLNLSNYYLSPIVWDGIVYFKIIENEVIDPEQPAYYSDNQISSSHLCAIDVITGKEEWKLGTMKFKGSYSKQLTDPVISNGLIFLGRDDDLNNESDYRRHLCALDAKTGKEKWKFKDDGNENIDLSDIKNMLLFNDKICFNTGSNHFFVLDSKTGEEKWNYKFENDIISFKVTSKGTAYFLLSNSIISLDAQKGEEKWNYEVEAKVDSFIEISDGVVYFFSNDNHLCMVNEKSAKLNEINDKISGLPDEDELSTSQYIKSTYSELESMGFTAYEITYVFEGDESESLEIMAPWEDLGIIKKLYCKDYNWPADKVEIASEREITLQRFASLCGHSMNDTIKYIAEDDPYYKTL